MYKEFEKYVKTRLDIAVVLISGVVGYALDAQIDILSAVEAAKFAVLSSAGGLGFRYAVSYLWDVIKSKRGKSIEEKARSLLEYLKKEQSASSKKLIKKVSKLIDLYENGLISKEDLGTRIDEIIKTINK